MSKFSECKFGWRKPVSAILAAATVVAFTVPAAAIAQPVQAAPQQAAVAADATEHALNAKMEVDTNYASSADTEFTQAQNTRRDLFVTTDLSIGDADVDASKVTDFKTEWFVDGNAEPAKTEAGSWNPYKNYPTGAPKTASTYTYACSETGDHTITARATWAVDGYEAVTSSVTFTIHVTAPVNISNYKVSAADAPEDQTPTVTVSGESGQLDEYDYELKFFSDKACTQDVTSKFKPENWWESPDTDPGTYYVTATGKDGFVGTTAPVAFQVVAKGAQYKISYVLNGGAWAGSEGDSTYAAGTPKSLPTASALTRDRYEFAGWYDNEALSGQEVQTLNANKTGDVTLYAKWKVKTVSISLPEELPDDMSISAVGPDGKNIGSETDWSTGSDVYRIPVIGTSTITISRPGYKTKTLKYTDPSEDGKLDVNLEEFSDADRQAADSVDKLVADLPENPGIDQADAVKAARAAYDKLDTDQKTLLAEGTVERLEAAEASVEKAEKAKAEADAKAKAEADAKAAQSVSDQIAALAKEPTQAAVDAAQKAYEALTPDQQKLVANHDGIAAAQKVLDDAKAKAEADAKDGKKADKPAKKAVRTVKTLKVNTVTVNAKSLKKAAKAQGASVKKVTKVVLGSKVKKVSKGAFKGFKKVTTLELKTKKLTKKSVKGSLKSSKVKTVKVKIGSKKTNKRYVKAYKKIFTKANAGKKVQVKL